MGAFSSAVAPEFAIVLPAKAAAGNRNRIDDKRTISFMIISKVGKMPRVKFPIDIFLS